MQDLLVNLVDNAAKAYDEDSATRIVMLSCSAKTICVEDRGRGISQESLSHLFEPFYMADPSRSKKNGGSGLGLAIVKAIADAHDAQIHIKSDMGQGTQVFWIFHNYSFITVWCGFFNFSFLYDGVIQTK